MRFTVVVIYTSLVLCVLFIVLHSYNSLSHKSVFPGQYIINNNVIFLSEIEYYHMKYFHNDVKHKYFVNS